MKSFLSIIAAALLVLAAGAAKAQFYNGHQMNFGQNRVQYSEFEWMFYRYPKYDTYFYQQGKDIAQFVSDRAQAIIPEMEKYFGKTLQRRVIFIVFNRIEEFRQSNIGLETDNSQTNLGGVTKILDNKVFLYFDGDHNRLDSQIREAVAQILMGVSINGNGIRNKVSGSMSVAIPEWYSRGLAFYAASPWCAETEDIIKDGFESGKYKKIQFLQGDDAKYAGYSMWNFINRTFGRDAIKSIIYFTGVNKDCAMAIKQVTNQKFRSLNKQWSAYYKEKFGLDTAKRGKSENKSWENSLLGKRGKRGTEYMRPMHSPDGKYIFYATSKEGKTKAMLKSAITGKTRKILRRGQPLEQIQEYNYPAAAWHPTGRVLSFAIEEQGYAYLYQYNVETKALSRRLLPRFDKVFSMDYSPDGLDMVMSAQVAGNTDLVLMNIASGAFEMITQDQADDINPKFAGEGRKIIFASNRLKDTLRAEKPDDHDKIGKTYDIFEYDLKSKSKVLRRITDTKYENETYPDELQPNSYTYLSDKSGIVNRFASVYDSTIIAIDTAVHYSYTNHYSHASDFEHSARSMSLSKDRQSIDFSFRRKGRQLMRQESAQATAPAGPLETTYFRRVQDKRQAKADSLEAARLKKAAEERRRTDSIVANPPKNLQNPDSMKYNILNYYFEEEKSLAHQLIFYGEDIKARHARQKAERPGQRLYFTNFYTDYLVSQVDFSSLSQSYQLFTGGPYYFNPGVSAFFKVGCKDLFEDYRLSAAFRIGGNLDSYEFYFSFEDLKHRLDKQYIFHRSQYNKDLGDYAVGKVTSNEAMIAAGYPFSQTSSLRGSAGLRYDKAQYQVTDVQYLDLKPEHQLFAKAKAEYVFDNSRMITTNIPSGLKMKGWSEIYQQLDGRYDIISTWGFDLRYYQKIHRCLILATRLAGATSFGSGKILYYLGGVDNWQTFSSDQSKRFDQSVRINTDENYIYQAVGTNMRGFIQNCRNGNTFAVLNAELRLPLFRYLFNRPIKSKMINDFQILGFFDAGSAWTGLVPGKDNAYNKYEVSDGPITMIMDVDRPTMVAGYGFGLRTTLLGYFLRFDWAWGLEGKVVLPKTFYFSLGFDF